MKPPMVQALHKVSMQHYDLLITDVNMPNMDGFELTRKPVSKILPYPSGAYSQRTG